MPDNTPTNQDLLQWLEDDSRLQRQILLDMRNYVKNEAHFTDERREEFRREVRLSFAAWYSHGNEQPNLNLWNGRNE